MLFHPAGAAAYNLYSFAETFQNVPVSLCGGRKLNCHIGALEFRAVKVLRVVYIYPANDIVATGKSNLLYLVAHFSVTDK